MANTPNYGLYKPDRADTTVEVDTSLANNFTTIDTKIKANEDGLASHESSTTAHDSANITHSSGSVKDELDSLDTRVTDIETNGVGGGTIPTDLNNRLVAVETTNDTQDDRITDVENNVNGMLAPTTFDELANQTFDYDTLRFGYVDNKLTPINTELDDHASQLADKAKNYVANVLEFGAVGNQNVVFDSTNHVYTMTDSSTAFQNAINSGYSIIIVPFGNYLIESVVTISKPVLIIGYGANIYTSPTSASSSKRVFSLGSSANGSIIEGLSFYSNRSYLTNLVQTGTSAITSNVIAIDNNGANNVTVRKCNGDSLTYIVSCQNCDNTLLTDLYTNECYFSIYTGIATTNVTIKNSHLKGQSVTDVYGHVLYHATGSQNILIDNCLLEMVGAGSNIVKVGANDGSGHNVVIKNSTLTGIVSANVLYIDSDLSLYNCILNFTSGTGGYARLIQFSSNAGTAYFKDCTITLDTFDRYTQNLTFTQNSLIFEGCRFTVKNTIIQYCCLSFVAGAITFRFINCSFDRSALSYGINLLDPALYSVHLYNCKFIINSSETIGNATQSNISYSSTNTPKFRAVNCEFQRYTDATGAVFMNNVSYNSYVPLCQLINVTLINCDAKTGANTGLYKLTGVDSQYVLNNVLNIAK